MRLPLILLAAAAALAIPPAASAQQWTVRLDLRGKTLEGAPLNWTDGRVHLLGRDGYLWEFAPHEAKNYEKTSTTFQSLTAGETRARLLAELGGQYEVSGAGAYLVAHRAGERDQWAARFDELYRSFMQYFAARGFRPRTPQFPLVAIVFPTQQEFLHYARQSGSPAGPGVLGYYSPVTNRVLLFDVTAGRAGDPNWFVNAETIIHEAVHQTAFNTGVHGRFTQPPRWAVEGLGTMFEAPGMWNSRHFPEQSQRINRGRLDDFRRIAPSLPKGYLADLVASDRIFQRSPGAAYAQAWALTFFLAEQEKSNYGRYLAQTAQIEPFGEYSDADRLRDFTAAFGSDFTMLEARLLRFINSLP